MKVDTKSITRCLIMVEKTPADKENVDIYWFLHSSEFQVFDSGLTWSLILITACCLKTGFLINTYWSPNWHVQSCIPPKDRSLKIVWRLMDITAVTKRIICKTYANHYYTDYSSTKKLLCKPRSKLKSIVRLSRKHATRCYAEKTTHFIKIII